MINHEDTIRVYMWNWHRGELRYSIVTFQLTTTAADTYGIKMKARKLLILLAATLGLLSIAVVILTIKLVFVR